MLARKKVLGNYNVGKTVGQGAFSKVKLGVHKETGQKVAIKIIDKKLMAQKAAKAKKAEEERKKKKEAEAVAKAAKEVGKRPSTTKEGRPSITQEGRKSATAKTSADRKKEEGAKDKENPNETHEPEVKVGIAPDAPSFIASLQLEVQLMMRLDHPHIINLYSIMETDDECFVVMEYASGGELIEYIAARNYLTEREARKFFRQLISAMDHCHMASVVHRDLKLENLLLNDNRDLLISDFGLGRTYNPEVQEFLKTFCGTPNYAAVELISGIPYNGIKSDIWAMGVALYVMMTGKTPFTGATISQLYSKIKAVDYKCPEYFSGDLKALLAKMLKKDPVKRADIEALRNDPWVNFEEVERPLRIMPKVTGIATPAQVTQFISAINKMPDYTVYTIRAHTRDGRSMEGAGEEKNKSVQMRRKSLSQQPMSSDLNPTLLGRPRAGSRRFSNVGTIISVNDETIPPLPEKEDALSPLPGASLSAGRVNRRLSLQEPKIPPLPVKISQSATEATPPSPVGTLSHTATILNSGGSKAHVLPDASAATLSITSNSRPSVTGDGTKATRNTDFTGSQMRGRRATITIDIFGKKQKQEFVTVVDKGIDETPSASRATSAEASSSSFGNSRRKSTIRTEKTVPEDDRELQVIRRMSMVSPDRGSFDRSQTNSRPADSDLETFSATSSMFSPTNSSYFSPSATTVPVPSEKEIEKWHEFNRPPKEIRTARYSFNPKTTSTLSPNYIFQDVHRVLVSMQKIVEGRLVFTRPSDFYLIQCKLTSENEEVDFDVEVCKVWLLQLHGVRIKKQGGSALKFKEAYSIIVDMMNIS